jgi:hypothetical protein
MAESGEDPVLRFNSLEDNREIPIRFDGIEVVNESGRIKERHEAIPREARRQLNQEFVAHVRAGMTEEEVFKEREAAWAGMEYLHGHISTFSFRMSLDPKRTLKFYSGKRYGRQLGKKMSLKLQSKIPFQKAEDMKKIYFFRRNLNPNRILFLVPAIHMEENILNFPIYY